MSGSAARVSPTETGVLAVQTTPLALALAVVYRSSTPWLFGTFLAISALSIAIIFGSNFFEFFQFGVDTMRNTLQAIELQFGHTGRLLRIWLATALVSVMFLPLFLVPAVMLWICPIQALTKRMVFLAGGLIVLIVLNALSNYAPTLRALLTAPPT